MENQTNQDSILEVNNNQLNENDNDNDNNNIDNDNLDFLLNKYNIDRNKYIVPAYCINSYNKDDVIGNKNDIFDLICPICYNILKNPKRCSLKPNSHSFCKECIDKYLKQSDNCPICKGYFEYKPNFEMEKVLRKIYFKCLYYKEGCTKILKYSEYFNHIDECQYKHIIYECKVEKFNYLKNNFVKCDFRGDIKAIEKHFKNCAFLKFKCIFCNDNILKINFREHLENTFNITIINFSEGDKFIGEIKNGKSHGYGRDYYLNGDKYEG